MKIVVRRSGALGDVVLATPIVRRLRRENPDADIAVQTAFPDVFRRSPHATADDADTSAVDRLIDLDLSYERQPRMHIVEAYMIEAFGDPGEPADRRQEMFFPPRRVFARNPTRRYVAVHAARAGWRNRTLPSATWVEVCRLLRRADLWPILVGSTRDALPGANATSFHAPDLHAQAQLIASCDCFVGSDSGLLHVAGATDTPIVGVFTCAKPEYRLPYRDRVRGIVPDLGCVGCLERVPPPVTVESCERGDTACVGAVSPVAIVAAVLDLLGTENAPVA